MRPPRPDDPAGVTAGEPVAEHMSRRMLIVRGDCALGAAMPTVLASEQRHVVVVDARGRFEGVLPVEVITSAWMTRRAHPPQVVRDLISVPPVHLSPDASMHTAASVMLSSSVDAAGVLGADGRPVGILTWSDVLAMVADRERA